MKVNAILVSVVISATLLGGCGRDYRNEPFLDFEGTGPHYQKVGVGFETLRINPFKYSGGGGDPYYTRVVNNLESDEPKARYYRNALLEAMIVASDSNTSTHLSELKATESGLNLIFGATALGLTGGAAVAPAATASALAAASTGVQGARALVNEEIYVQSLAESVIMLIIEERKAVAEKIRQNYSKSMYEYPVERAIADVSEYHEMGSVYFGLSLARQAIEKETISKRGASGSTLTSTSAALAAALSRLEALNNEKEVLEIQKKQIEKVLREEASGVKKNDLEQRREDVTRKLAELDRNIESQKLAVNAHIEAERARLNARKVDVKPAATTSGGT